jgi:MFS superfamily sulfate permease-like transporter
MEEIERLEAHQTILILSMRGVPLVDATGVEVLREAWQRQHEGGGDLLVSGLQPRVQVLLQRSGFLAQIGAQRVFWSADQAILSLSQPVEHAEPITEGVGNALDTAQLLTPYEERFDEGL